MKNPWIRIITWLGIMTFFTLLAMGIWLAACHGSQSTESLKWLQLLQSIGTFGVPPIVCAWIWATNHRCFSWLGLSSKISGKTAIFAIVIMLCAIPSINFLADLNSRVVLPSCLHSIESFLRQQEEAAALLTERFLYADDVWTMLVNIGLIALMPALTEELTFRGTLQQIMAKGQKDEGAKMHVAIWVTAIIFSAIHMQFFGFIPRMLLGAIFGYAFVWTGSLLAPILMHFTNNGMAVLSYYLLDKTEENKSWADTIGAGSTWWVGILSIMIVCALLLMLKKSVRKDV
ncbi:MAG: CPBP family intramembrane metalloprotease [Paludibacteraceae bacterium]|nr:CPBP family intramembrane metalloprotease [Paludibacteraceae bacterium]